MKNIVRRSFYQHFTSKYPKLLDEQKYRSLLLYLAFGTFCDEDDSNLIVDYATLWKMQPELKNMEIDRHLFIAKVFLDDFRRDVLPCFVYINHNYHNKSREVGNSGFDQEDQNIIQDELNHFLNESGTQYINFITEQLYYGKNKTEHRQYFKNEYQEQKKHFKLNDRQKIIIDYLDQVNEEIFIRKYGQNKELIWQEYEKIETDRKKERNLRIIHDILEKPQVFYKPSDKGNTSRLSPINGVPTLKSELRKAWSAGWMEADLKSSQLTILATILNAPITKSFIEQDKDIWIELYKHTHNKDEKPPKEIKAIYKQLIYSICFGKAEKHSKGYYFNCRESKKKPEDDLYTICRSNKMLNLLEHPIIRELLELRSKWHEHITLKGGMKDIYGEFHAITKERWAGQIGGTIIQAIELDIISSVFDVAMQYGKSYRFLIPFFQHDGFTLSILNKDRQEMVVSKLQQAVKERAAKYNISTKLEFNQL